MTVRTTIVAPVVLRDLWVRIDLYWEEPDYQVAVIAVHGRPVGVGNARQLSFVLLLLRDAAVVWVKPLPSAAVTMKSFNKLAPNRHKSSISNP